MSLLKNIHNILERLCVQGFIYHRRTGKPQTWYKLLAKVEFRLRSYLYPIPPR